MRKKPHRFKVTVKSPLAGTTETHFDYGVTLDFATGFARGILHSSKVRMVVTVWELNNSDWYVFEVHRNFDE